MGIQIQSINFVIYMISYTLLISITGCNLVDSKNQVYEYPACALPVFEMHNHLPNFGFEEGYFYWYEDEKIPLLRNQNHLSIRFHEELGRAFHDSVLAEYNIEPIWSQTYNLQVPLPGFYRVIDEPAEFYYTTYGDTTLDRLGNLPGVEYVLQTYYENEWFCDYSNTPRILFNFHDFITEEDRQSILDSLQLADRIELRQLNPGEVWSPFDFYITKNSRKGPYELYQHYYNEFYINRQIFESISPNFAQTARN